MTLNTRLRILDYLRKQQTATVHELSRVLAMTGANVRHHLEMLESNDLIEVIGQRHAGRGRPENIYSLSRLVLGDGLDELAGALLDVWLKEAGKALGETGLQSVALRLAGGDKSEHATALLHRLTRTVDRLIELHYQARWVAAADGAHIILGHCPYAAIIADHPELCRVDAYLLEQLTGMPAEQMVKLQPSAQGYPFCTFRLEEHR